MYLVDTSVWVDYIRGRDRPHVRFLRDLLSNPVAVGITHLICMEILQGARDAAAFDRIRDYFSGQRFHSFEDMAAGHASAARIHMECRHRGVTLRSTADCLIAQCAMESDPFAYPAPTRWAARLRPTRSCGVTTPDPRSSPEFPPSAGRARAFPMAGCAGCGDPRREDPGMGQPV